MSESLPQPKWRAAMLLNGVSDSELRNGQDVLWSRVRHGAYVSTAEWAELNHERQHLVLIAATAPRLGRDSVISHLSAAAMHRLPVVGQRIQAVHITRQHSNGGFIRGCVHSHVGHLEPHELVVVDGLPVTSLTRTLFDCLRTAPYDTALVLADCALHLGLASRADLAAMLTRRARLRGLRQARDVISFADSRSESPGESIARIRLAQHDLPAPRLQYEIRRNGILIARTDFAWPQFRTLGEFDGAVKYTTLLRPGQSAQSVIEDQQAREEDVRALGWKFVRWGWTENSRFEAVAAALRSTFSQPA